MKKSNKLLLGGFLTLLLFITAIHITLYAKYKAGNFRVYNAEDDLTSVPMHSFPNILFVSVRNVPHATVRFGDVAKMRKEEASDLQYVQKGDTLLISRRDSTENGGFQYPVAFHLPSNATLSVFNSSLSFEGGNKTSQPNPAIYLEKSYAVFPGEQSPLHLGKMRIVATENSMAVFKGRTQVDQLDVQLLNSTFEAESNFSQLSITTDSLSRISLPAKNLLKANIKTTAE